MAGSILYRDIAPGAAEDMTVTTSGAADFCDVSLLPYGDGAYTVPSLELNAWGLDGGADGDTAAYWSDAVSDETGTFATPPTVTLTFTEQYTSTGITLVFAPGDYCTDVNIKWYRNSSLRAEADFAPDADSYFCEKNVETFNSVVITFRRTFLPYRRAKLSRVYIGTYRSFGEDELRNVSVANETDLITARLPASQLRWTLDSKNDVDYMFQLKQPVEAYLDGELFCVYYVTESNRRGRRLYDVVCQDAFGVMETIPFTPKKYDNVSAAAAFTEAVGGRFPLYITATDRPISGVITATNLREAARQILFAWGVCAATDGCDGIRVFNVSATVTEIGKNRIYSGVSVTREAAITKVNVTAHDYVESENGSVEVGGVKYEDVQSVFTVINPLVTPSNTENVIEVTTATLVSPLTAQRTARNVYNYYAGLDRTTATVLWNGERLGQPVSVFNEWGGRETGNIEKLEMIFSHTLAAKLTLRETEISEGRYFAGEVFAGEVEA